MDVFPNLITSESKLLGLNTKNKLLTIGTPDILRETFRYVNKTCKS